SRSAPPCCLPNGPRNPAPVPGWRAPGRAPSPRVAPRRSFPPSSSYAALATDRLERTLAASGPRPADLLAQPHELRVVVVEEGRVSGKAIHEEALDLVVAEPAPEQPEAREDPARVRVDHEERLAGRVERDRVGGLGSDAV